MKVSQTVFLLLCFLLFMTSSLLAKEIYTQPQRIKYLENVISSMRNTSLKTLEDAYEFLALVEKNQCRSSLERLRVMCLIESATKNCQARSTKSLRNQCKYYSDIAMINRFSEERLIPARKRYDIMRDHKDYRTHFLRELSYQQAVLATEFNLSQHLKCDSKRVHCLAKGIDQFCLEYSDKHSLSWQYCMGALVWFIGTTKRKGPG